MTIQPENPLPRYASGQKKERLWMDGQRQNNILYLFYSDYYANGLFWWRKRVCMSVSVLKIETVRVQASPLS